LKKYYLLCIINQWTRNRTPQTMTDINDLIHPINLNKLDMNEINFFSGIPDLYFDDQNPLTLKQSEFYNDVKFPNYDDI